MEPIGEVMVYAPGLTDPGVYANIYQCGNCRNTTEVEGETPAWAIGRLEDDDVNNAPQMCYICDECESNVANVCVVCGVQVGTPRPPLNAWAHSVSNGLCDPCADKAGE